MKDLPVIIIVESVYKKAKEVFDEVYDFKIIINSGDEFSLAEVVEQNDPFAVVLGTAKYTGLLYEKMPKGGILARFGVGYDSLDFGKVKDNGLIVTNTPGILDVTVAESTVFLAAEVLRKFGLANTELKKGIWHPYVGNDLNGKTWAIIGLGNIGKRLSKILAFGFGVKVYGLKLSHTDSNKIKEECGVEKIFSDFSEIATQADIVSLHLPANFQTRHYINRIRLDQMKRGAILINTGRGSLIDEEALYDSLISGSISGAGLDVFDQEPYLPVNTEKDLRKLPNVVMTPHISSSTMECSQKMALSVLRNIRYALKKEYNYMNIID